MRYVILSYLNILEGCVVLEIKNIRLKQERESKQLSQEKLGAIVGRSRLTIYAYENGRRTPNSATKKKLADFFGVTVDYLFFDLMIEEESNRNEVVHKEWKHTGDEPIN